MKAKKLLIFIISLLFLSCSKDEKKIISVEDNQTLKYLIKEKESEINWSKEIEPEILESDINYLSSVDINVQISKELPGLLKKDNPKKYPSISDFTIIDTSGINETALKTVNEFCSAVCKNINSSTDKFINKDLFFVYIFFKSNLLENWENMFNEKFPYTFEDINNEKKLIKIFDDYIIGIQTETEDFYEIPVRLNSKDKYLNLVLYVEKQDNYIIDEISITGWGINNGN